MVALAEIVDVEARLGRALSSIESNRVDALLADASAAIRRRSKQQITAGVSSPIITIEKGRAVLPERPVVAVTSVTTLDGTPVDFTHYAPDGFLLIGTVDQFDRESVKTSFRARVTYSHGYSSVPDDLVAVCAQMVGRALGTTPEASAVQQESLGAYSYSVGSAAASGGLGMLSAEGEVVDSYIPAELRFGTARVGVPW